METIHQLESDCVVIKKNTLKRKVITLIGK